MHLILPFIAQRAAGAAPMTFSGTAAVYGRTDDNRDYTIARGAFDSAVAAAQKGNFPAMLLEHGGWGMGAEDGLPIGVWTDLSVDSSGLQVSGKLAETQRGRDVYALLSMEPRPGIDGMSIGFRPTQRQVNDSPAAGEPRVTITDMEILEISVVTFPAMGAARVASVQSMTERELERRLTRDAGLTRRQARALMREGWPALEALRDAGESTADSPEGALVPPDELAALKAAIQRNIQTLKG